MDPLVAVAAAIFSIVNQLTDKSLVKNADDIAERVKSAVAEVTGVKSKQEAEQKLADSDTKAKLAVKIQEIALEAQKLDKYETAEFNENANNDTFDARKNLLEILQKSDSLWILLTPTVISYFVVLGFFCICNPSYISAHDF